MNGYKFTKEWFAFSRRNITVLPVDTALYLWLVECNNRQYWREGFAFAYADMEACLHITYKTFKKSFNRLIIWSFITIIAKPVNRHHKVWEIRLLQVNSSASIGIFPEAGLFTLGEIPDVEASTVGKIPEVNPCSMGKIPGVEDSSVGKIPTVPIYNTKTFFFKENNLEGENPHAHEEQNQKNPVLENPAEEKKKSSAQKRKEEFVEREFRFKASVFAYADTYSPEILQAFFDHWSEPDAHGKMRYELEPTWELSRRLRKWLKREQEIIKPKTYGQTAKFQAKANGYAAEELDYNIPL